MPFVKRRLLVVTADEALRADLEAAVGRLGVVAAWAGDADSAVDLLGRERTDALLVDLDLPDVGGVAVLRELRLAGIAVPAIATGAAPTVDALIQLLRLRVCDFLKRPFGGDDLAAAFERVLAEAAVAPAAAARPAPRSAMRGGLEPRPGRGLSSRAAAGASRPAAGSAATARARSGPAGPPPRAVVQDLVEQLRDGRVQLPTLAPVASQLKELLVRPNCGADKVEEVVAQDPTVAGEVLRVANSTLYRGDSPITTLRAACVRLGNGNVFSIAQEAALKQLFAPQRPPFGQLAQVMWRNVRVTAAVARELARTIGGIEPDEAHLAAMLHNMGEVVLLQLVAKLYEKQSFDEALLPQLAAQLAETHERFGQALLGRWRMPAHLVALAGCHHAEPGPDSEVVPRLRHLVMAAWTSSLKRGLSYQPGQEEVDPTPFLEALGLDEEKVAEAFQAALESLEATGEGA